MHHHSIMIKPASSLCNLRCRYCFYYDVSARRESASYGLMTPATSEAVIANVFSSLAAGDALSVAFQGGEPTLAGLPFFQHFIGAVRRQEKPVAVSYALQTNGTELDDPWCAFLREHDFLVGLSMDGYAKHHNTYRVDPAGRTTYSRALRAQRLLDAHGVAYNVLCTLTNELARHPARVWQFIQQQRIAFIQFTPCLNDLDAAPREWGLTPQRFHSFYVGLYDLWKQALYQGQYISVKLFDDIVNLLVRGEVTACGLHGRCQAQCVVESNGNVYPCDFYVLDEYCCGSLASSPLTEVQKALKDTGFASSRATLPESCGACKYLKLCNGGCKRLAASMYVEETTGFCGYRRLLEDIGQDLLETGMRLLRRFPPQNG